MHDQILLLRREVQYAAGYIHVYLGMFLWCRAQIGCPPYCWNSLHKLLWHLSCSAASYLGSIVRNYEDLPYCKHLWQGYVV